MTGPTKRPGQWPVGEPVDLDAIAGPSAAVDTPNEDDLYVQRAAELALHEMVLGSIQHDLRQQPTPLSVLTAARNWCTRITAAAEDIAQEKRKAA
ncbi:MULTISPECIES: hypothetical protein [unclassified Streptomyces]|uniref:hypothetical protein n=1 Tax=unclassified Streptomyces TaxID=2593676 RepID=UPI0037FCFA65